MKDTKEISRKLDRETELTRKRYDRISRVYNLMELMEAGKSVEWRKRLFNEIIGHDVLEVGVGTGRNLEFYSPVKNITGIDLSEKMLTKARRRAKCLGLGVKLEVADVQNLPFPDNSFDSVITACVFCSVPDPIKGLQEIRRVLRPNGRLIMLEHVLSCKPVARGIMRMLNPVVRRVVGANIDRDTVGNLEKAGFSIKTEENLWLDIMKFIVAEPDEPK